LNLKERQHIAKKQLQQQQQHFLDWAYAQLLSPKKDYVIRNTKANQASKPLLEKQCLWLELGKEILLTTSQDLTPLLDGVSFKVTEHPTDPDTREEKQNEFLRYVKLYSPTIQEEWLNRLSKRGGWGISKSVLKNALSDAEEISIRKHEVDLKVEEGIKELPKDCDKEMLLKHGFAPAEDNTGYYFLNSKGGYDKVANFVLKPLFHIYGQDNKRYVEVSNKFKSSRILIDSKEMATVDRLHTTLFNEGGFVAGTISKPQYMTLLEYWGQKFPKCYELNSLGYQSEGFFAFSNKVYNGKLSDFDQLGIYKHEDQNFLSPSVVESLLDIRENEKETEFDQYLTYVESPVSLEEYLKLYAKVFGDHAVYGLGFIMLSIFRDIAIKSNNIPHLYAHGPTSSGKSKFIENTMHFFFAGKNSENKKLQPYQLANGTEASLFQYMQRTSNVLVAYNEVDIKSASEDRILLFKGVYDGEGRSKMNGVKRNIITQYSRCCIALVGQFMYTGDDGSIVNRSIPCKFVQREKGFTQQETDNFKRLEDITNQGVSSLITDFLRHRETVALKYQDQYNRCAKDLRVNTHQVNSRLIDNYSHILTLYTILGDVISLPFDNEFVRTKIMEDMEDQNELVRDNGVVNDFWETVQFMLSTREIQSGVEIDMQAVMELNLSSRKKEEQHVVFDKSKDVLFLNMAYLHRKYEMNCRKRGVGSLSKQNLLKYIADHQAYLGNVKVHQFNPQIRTSAYAFDCTKLPIDIEAMLNENAAATGPQEKKLEVWVSKEPELVTQGGMDLLKFRAEVAKYPNPVERYSCYSVDVEKQHQLTAGARVVATGILECKQMIRDGDVITWNEFRITTIHQIEPRNKELFDKDDEDDELPF
jgi:hypothetical protein